MSSTTTVSALLVTYLGEDYMILHFSNGRFSQRINIPNKGNLKPFTIQNPSNTMYKVVFTVVEVGEPKSIDGNPTHVTGPCKMYKVGDKMTVTGNPGRLLLEETDHFVAAVPYFMKRPLQTVIYYKHEQDYLHHVDEDHLTDLAGILRKNTSAVISLMEKMGREPAYNIIFHSGPGAQLYLELLPYTQETGGYEHLGIYVCQGSPRTTAEMYKKTGIF